MDYYFLMTYYTQPKNKKQTAVVDYCQRFEKILALNRSAIDAMHAELKILCDKLNKKFPKSRKICVVQNPFSESFTIKEEGNVHNDVFRITATKVLGTYEFSEKIEQKLLNIE